MRKHSSERGVIRRPKMAPHLRVNVVAVDPSAAQKSLLVTSEYDKDFYRIHPIDDAAEELLAAIDGRAEAAQLIRDLTAKTQRAHHEIAMRLQVFARAGLIISGQYRMNDGDAAVWLQRGFTPAFVEHALGNMRIAMVDLSTAPAAARALKAALHACGVMAVTRGDADGTAALRAVLVDDYLQDALADINRAARRAGDRWLPVKLTGGAHMAGPVFNHGDDGGDNHRDRRPFMATDFCWRCLATRLRGNRQIEQALHRQAGITPSPPPVADNALQAGAHAVAMQVAGYLLATVADAQANRDTVTVDESLASHVFVFDQVAGESMRCRVNKNPACEVCGAQDATPSCMLPVELNDAEPGLRYAGGWRSVPPEVTFANYRHLNNAVTGVVAKLEAVANPGDDNCFVYESDNNIATQSDSLFMSLSSVQMRNAGKGVTPAMARAGALCEALERYCASLQGDEVRRRARYVDFPDGHALMPNLFMNLSAAQFASRDAFNVSAFGNPFVNIPAPLHEDEFCEWSPLWSATERALKWAPTQSLYYGYPYAGHWIAIPDTNGVAAGNTLTEAFVHAFLEVLERDAVSLWWYNRLQCKGVDLASAARDVPLVERVLEQEKRRGRACWALDLSFDLGASVFAFMSRQAAGDGEVCLGFGAHFDAEIALSRAICEHGQLWGMIESRREVGDGDAGDGAAGGVHDGGDGVGDGSAGDGGDAPSRHPRSPLSGGGDGDVHGDGNHGDRHGVVSDGDGNHGDGDGGDGGGGGDGHGGGDASTKRASTFRDLSPAFSAWLARTTTADPAYQYLLPAGETPWRDYPDRRRLDLPAQRDACLALVEAKGWQLYLADFTRPGIGLPVLRVMVPQLRSMHRRLAPGRLYDTPVQLGLLDRPTPEDAMNPIDIFI